MNICASMTLSYLLALNLPDGMPPLIGVAKGKCEIKFTAGSPAHPQDGKIKALGNYTPTVGWSVLSITLKCAPVGGGLQLSRAAAYQNGSWSAEIAPVPAGTYNVYAEMVITSPAKKRQVTIGSGFKNGVVVK